MASGQRIRRLIELVAVLQSGRKLNSADLARECGVSRRTIFRDLRALQEAGLPVRYDEEQEAYTLTNRVFVPPLDFTFDEALSMVVLATQMCDPVKGIPFERPACSAARKLLGNLPFKLRESVGRVENHIKIALEPHNPLNGSTPVFDLLKESLRQYRQVRIRYQSLMSDEPQEFSTLLSPYRLFFGRRSWYVIGRSSLHRAVRTFHLGRIRKAELIDSRYTIPKHFSLRRYLGDAWFLIRERKNRHQVTVRFQPLVAKNVAEVCWHHTQKLRWHKDGTLDFHVTVDGLTEIQWWILGYGDQAEVIRPKKLRDMIRERVRKMHERYHPEKQRAATRRTKTAQRNNRRKRNSRALPAEQPSRSGAEGTPGSIPFADAPEKRNRR